MKKEITRREVLVLFKGLTEVVSLQGAKFAYAVIRNIDKLRPLAIEISNNAKPPEKYWEYESKYKIIVDRHSKTEKGDDELLKKEIKDLNSEYKDVLKETDKKQKETEKYLDEKIEVELYIIPITYFPEDIDGSKLEPIKAIIE